ncbi:MAG: response regulator [Acidobacteria bacterium]|nr:MAG: response regulator [Acidobacteriota bacterium]PYX60452.1 MAG: response regulator [Acidobacteriota bacterium]PYX63614.1 MAG: response regulator [Acidobacteriota bacterium]
MKSDPAKILCIDDEEPGLELRKLLLESAGYHVITARSGAEGIQLFRSQPVDVIILDYWMSGMNGVSVARELKRLNAAIPIIILSAYASLPDEALGVADVWILKGDATESLLASIKDLLETRKAG